MSYIYNQLDEEQKEKEPDFLQRKSNKLKKRDFLENFQMRKDQRFKKESVKLNTGAKLLSLKSYETSD